MHHSQVTVRPAAPADLEAFFGLVDALADYERLARPTPEARERLARDGFGAERLFHPFIAEIDGAAVGYAMVFYTYSSFLALPTLFLEDLFVLEEARGKGAGSALFRYVAAEAVQRGCGRMEWVVLDWNRPAIDFYERMGARRLSEWYTYRLTGEEIARVAEGAAG